MNSLATRVLLVGVAKFVHEREKNVTSRYYVEVGRRRARARYLLEFPKYGHYNWPARHPQFICDGSTLAAENPRFIKNKPTTLRHSTFHVERSKKKGTIISAFGICFLRILLVSLFVYSQMSYGFIEGEYIISYNKFSFFYGLIRVISIC